jgi:three-Cys-motif partner protein
VGPWSLQKYRLLDLYNTLFSTGMKRQWDLRVYIDLFSGPGRARVRNTKRVVETSPIIALRVPDPFDKYIFCDREAKNISALRDRVRREFPGVEPSYVIGDCNEVVAKIVGKIPKASKGKSVLSFCFADPFGIDDLKFRACLEVGGAHDAHTVSSEVIRTESWGRCSPRRAASASA